MQSLLDIIQNAEDKYLSGLFASFLQLQFPHATENKKLHELYTELVEYDSYLAGLISRYLSGDTELLHLTFYEDSLERKLLEIKREKPDLSEDANSYLEYLEKLKVMINWISTQNKK